MRNIAYKESRLGIGDTIYNRVRLAIWEII